MKTRHKIELGLFLVFAVALFGGLAVYGVNVYVERNRPRWEAEEREKNEKIAAGHLRLQFGERDFSFPLWELACEGEGERDASNPAFKELNPIAKAKK